MLRRNINRPIVTCAPSLAPDEMPVNGKLAITPSQMAQMMDNGIPISAQMLDASNFYDGCPNPSWDVDILNQRGVDLADAWCASMDAKDKMRKNGITNVHSNRD